MVKTAPRTTGAVPPKEARKRTHKVSGILGQQRARELLDKHGLRVDTHALERLACLRVGHISRGKGERSTPPLAKILTHARAVKKCLTGEASRKDSLLKRCRKLYQELDNMATVVRFSVATPLVNVVDIQRDLENGSPSLADIEALIIAAEAFGRSRGGRPPALERLLVNRGKFIWAAAGRRATFPTDRNTDKLKPTPFVCFLLDLFKVCDRRIPSDAALRGYLRAIPVGRKYKIT